MKSSIRFRPGQRYMRRAEFGVVREVTARRVVMDVSSGAKRISGVETFNPTRNPGWELCA